MSINVEICNGQTSCLGRMNRGYGFGGGFGRMGNGAGFRSNVQ